MTADQLEALAERVEAGEGPDRGLDGAIMDAVFQPWRGYAGVHDAYTNERVEDAGWIDGKGSRWIGAPRLTASIEAAMTLVPEGWHWSLRHMPIGDYLSSVFLLGTDPQDKAYDQLWHTRGCATPALALTAAALRARAAMMRGDS